MTNSSGVPGGLPAQGYVVVEGHTDDELEKTPEDLVADKFIEGRENVGKFYDRLDERVDERERIIRERGH